MYLYQEPNIKSFRTAFVTLPLSWETWEQKNGGRGTEASLNIPSRHQHLLPHLLHLSSLWLMNEFGLKRQPHKQVLICPYDPLPHLLSLWLMKEFKLKRQPHKQMQRCTYVSPPIFPEDSLTSLTYSDFDSRTNTILRIKETAVIILPWCSTL